MGRVFLSHELVSAGRFFLYRIEEDSGPWRPYIFELWETLMYML